MVQSDTVTALWQFWVFIGIGINVMNTFNLLGTKFIEHERNSYPLIIHPLTDSDLIFSLKVIILQILWRCSSLQTSSRFLCDVMMFLDGQFGDLFCSYTGEVSSFQ